MASQYYTMLGVGDSDVVQGRMATSSFATIPANEYNKNLVMYKNKLREPVMYPDEGIHPLHRIVDQTAFRLAQDGIALAPANEYNKNLKMYNNGLNEMVMNPTTVKGRFAQFNTLIGKPSPDTTTKDATYIEKATLDYIANEIITLPAGDEKIFYINMLKKLRESGLKELTSREKQHYAYIHQHVMESKIKKN